MFYQVITFELKYRLSRPATYIYFSLFLVICFLLTGIPDATVVATGDQLNKNAPMNMHILMTAITMYGSLVIAAVMGVPVFRDYDHNFHEIIFSLPVRKWEYLWGRFIGSALITTLIFLGIPLGLMFGNIMPWHDAEDFGSFTLFTYLLPYLTSILPNIFILGSLFFTVGSLFRSQAAIYAQGVLFLVVYLAINMLIGDVDISPTYALFDPFGLSATAYVTKYWTIFEKNTMQVPFSGLILFNRVLWLTLAFLVSIIFHRLFKFTNEGRFVRKKRILEEQGSDLRNIEIAHDKVIEISGFQIRFYQWSHLTRFYLRRIVFSVPFLIMLVCGIGFMGLVRFSMMMYGTPSLPVTYMLIDALVGGFMLFFIIIIIVYTGEVIWKDIGVGFSSIIDASPLKDVQLLFSKFTALVLMEIIMIGVMIVSGIAVQIINGFFEIQLVVYLKALFLNIFLYLVLITILAFFIHTLVNNKFLGHGIMVALVALNMFAGELGIRHILLKYADAPTRGYSGMNGFQKFVFPALSTDFYWFMLAVILLVISMLLIKRGSQLQLKSRIKNFKLEWNRGIPKVIVYSSLILFLASGTFIYYNTNVLNTYRTKEQERTYKANFEKTFGIYKDYPEPRITDIFLNVDIFPDTYVCLTKGHYKITNKHDFAIDTIHLMINPHVEINLMEFSSGDTNILKSEDYGFYSYLLDKPMQPGDTITLTFNLVYKEKGFHNWGRNASIVPNGTNFRADILPSLGYDERYVLTEKKDRKKEGLEERKFEAAELTDTTAYYNTYINKDADRINYEAIVSTDKDQIALTCGSLQKEWTEDNRRYFHYKMNEPIWNFFPFLSAKYEIYKDSLDNLDIAIYYHKQHDYNIEKMIEAIKKTVKYCEENFYPYQHDEIRIVEFPRYETYAQSLAGIIPFSEGIGFITDVDEKNDIDLPFYVTAHEVAHQWWGHQVCAADVKGKLIMVESMANYTALMVMEKEFGKKNMSKFLKYEQDRYLIGRSMERKKEVPLYLVDDQNYVAYNKGSVSFYTFRDYIGEEKLNTALSNFITDYSYKEPPYPTSLDFLSYIEEETPDSLKYLIDDLFKTITLFSNRIDSAKVIQTDGGQYHVKINAATQKFKSDSLGKEQEIKPDDWIDIGLIGKSSEGKDSIIYLQKFHIDSVKSEFLIIVESEPIKAGIDPQNKLIDRNLRDNTKRIRKKI